VRTLSVIGVEDGAILAADENGERFRIPVDESVRGRLAVSDLPPGKRLSPREIQAQVRAGLSVEEVAGRTGTPVAYVERFVRPVLAERAFVLESAMRVVVQPDAEADEASSFGAVLAERLAALDATDVAWTSLREAGGEWIISVSFRADDVDHRARWTFDPKRLVLEPENIEATTLSQQGTPTALTPRLRALQPTGPVALPRVAASDDVDVQEQPEPDRSRFDSAIFELPDLSHGAPQQGPVEAAVLLDALARKRVERETLTPTPSTVAPERAEQAEEAEEEAGGPEEAVPAAQGTVTRGRFPERAPEPVVDIDIDIDIDGEGDGDGDGDTQAQTQVLPEPVIRGTAEDALPLRRPRERGRRPEQQRRPEAQQRLQPQPQRPQSQQPKARQQQQARPPQARHVDMDPPPTRPVNVAPPAAQRARRGRTSLPSWDEIVFGKADD
jgi:hypothetical protein